MSASEHLQNPAELKSFSAVCVERGYCKPVDIVEATRERIRLEKSGGKKELSVLLVEMKKITAEQAHAAERAVRGATVIGGFEILEKVGQGGMGAVFRARQINMDRIVALKILPPKLAADESFKKRFLREARLSAKLNHLNLINGIEVGESAGYMFFAMEFVEGESARQKLKRVKRFDVEENYKIIRQICDALAYANKGGLVHRDIKPDNIMLTTQDIAKLCDMGLAKQDEGEREDASLTMSGQAVGTPHYISPEQARGEKDVDIRSDIYSLGATMYHMLTGQTPFEAATAAAIMARHLSDEATGPCELVPDLADSWGHLITKMMARDPGDRYQDVNELIEDLEAAHDGRPVEAASFKGKSSCAAPKKGRKLTTPSSASVRIGTKTGTKGRSATEQLQPITTGDRTTQIAPARRNPTQSQNLGSILVVGGVLLVGGLAFAILGGRHNTDNSANSNTAPADPQRTPPIIPVAQFSKKAEVTPPKVSGATTKSGEQDKKEAVPEDFKNTGSGMLPATKEPDAPEPEARPTPVVKPAPEPPKVVAAPTAKDLSPEGRAAYTAYLTEMLKRAETKDLKHATSEAEDLAEKPEYAAAKNVIKKDLEDLKAALAFESKIFQNLSKANTDVPLSRTYMDSFKMGKASGEKDGRLSISFGQNSTLIHGGDIENQFLLSEAAKVEGNPQGELQFLLVRASVEQARKNLDKLSGDDLARFQMKLDLLSVGAESQKAYKELTGLKGGDPSKFDDAIKAYLDKFGATSFAVSKGAEIAEWRKQISTALAEKAAKEIGVITNKDLLLLCSYGKDRSVREQDQKMEEHLKGLGFNVTTKNIWEIRPEDAQGKGLIVLTASVGGGDQLADKIRFMRDLQIPIISSSPGCYSALGLADDVGHSDGKVDFNVPLKDHVLTQKQKDAFTPLKEGEVMFAHPTSEALAVVTNKDNQDQVAVFAYEPGSQMKDDLRAPARRVGFFPFLVTGRKWNLDPTDKTWALFDQVVKWSASKPPPPIPVKKIDLAKLFTVAFNQGKDGKYWLWASNDAAAFQKDWEVSDPRNRKLGEFINMPGGGGIMQAKGDGGELWDHQRKGAVFIVPRSLPKLTQYRMEIAYSVNATFKDRDGYCGGIGLWGGGNNGLVFGLRQLRDGPLSVFGNLPGKGENEDNRNLMNEQRGFWPDRGQLAVQCDGSEWTFQFRDFNQSGENGWKTVHKMRVAGGKELQPCIAPFTWGDNAKIDFTVNAIRLTVLTGDPLLQDK